MKKTLYALICILAFSILLTLGASASIRTDIDIDAKCTLDIIYSANETGFENLEIKLFRVGNISRGGEYSLSDDFAQYPVEISAVKTQDEWKTIANTLLSYAVADSKTPTAVGKTDSDGKASFENLSLGLYLVMGVGCERDGEIFTFETFMVSLPNADENGNPKYNITAYPKHSSYIPEPEQTEYSVVKLWKDGGYSLRPDKIDIDIYKNGAFDRSIELSSKNSWSYSWMADDDGSVWTVVERNIAKDYTVEIVENERIFRVTNTYIAPPDVPQTGDTTNTWHYVLVMFITGSVLIVLAVKNKTVTANL